MAATIEVMKADPYRFVYGDERFSIQNMLIRQVNFPAFCHRGDFIADGYTDRMYDTVRAASEKYLNKDGKHRSVDSLSPEEFVEYCREACGVTDKVTGARIVRYTNVSSGYPCDRIDLYCRAEGNPEVPVYSGMDAPNVNNPKVKHRMFGGFNEFHFQDD